MGQLGQVCGEYKVGDTWFNSSESYCMYKWDGSNWIREQFGNGAFANASIALFDSVAGAQIELGNEKIDKAKLAQKYADVNSDPINAAKDGYIDAVIEPQFVKQYLIASLQMLAR
jgi:hypothetical protein